MSGLWTPSGERVPEPGPSEDTAGAARDPAVEEPVDHAVEEELRRSRADLAAVPVADIVANHAIGLWQLALLHLAPDPAADGSPTPPRLAEAGVAIDALGALVETLGDRLAPHAVALREALAQLRLAFVQLDTRPRA